MTNEKLSDKDFKPYGAIAFFVALMILALIIWFGIYYIMVNSTH